MFLDPSQLSLPPILSKKYSTAFQIVLTFFDAATVPRCLSFQTELLKSLQKYIHNFSLQNISWTRRKRKRNRKYFSDVDEEEITRFKEV